MQHKKQAHNIIEEICKINDEVWDNKKGTYDDRLEAAYQIEEALEGLIIEGREKQFRHPYLNDFFGSASPKLMSRILIDNIIEPEPGEEMSDVERADKHLDSIYYNIGSLYKLGMNAQDIVDALQVVHNANVAKSGQKDERGKVKKPENFVGPEQKIEEILDRRNK